jgi:hypothetical protein
MTSFPARALVVAIVSAAVLLVPQSVSAQKRQRDKITREEIQASAHKELDLFQAIRNLRPHFLAPPKGVRSFGNATPAAIVVYVDGKLDTGLDALRDIRASDVEEVRYMDPSLSESEFGPRANGGAVIVKRAKGAPARDTVKPPTR